MLSSLLSPLNNASQAYGENHFFSALNEDTSPLVVFRGPGVGLVTFQTGAGLEVRKELRLLRSHFRNIDIYDLGFITDENQKTAITELCNAAGILPVFIGNGSRGVENVENDSMNWVISNKIHSEFSLCNYTGYQRHLCTQDDIFQAEEFHYNHISLGKMRSNPAILEPTLRDVVNLYVDLRALRTCDAPNIKNTYPTGLNAEELCQIMRHAGTGGQVSAVHLEFELKNNSYHPEAQILAESIWYFTEGVNIRVADHPLKSHDFTNFVIHSTHIDEDLEYVKHNQTGKWWLKHPSSGAPRYLACSFEEYQSSIGEDLPERISKFIHSEF